MTFSWGYLSASNLAAGYFQGHSCAKNKESIRLHQFFKDLGEPSKTLLIPPTPDL